jgi:hypothetical protein
MSRTPRPAPRIEVIPPGAVPPDAVVPAPAARPPRPRRAVLAWIPGVTTLVALWAFMLDD